MVFSLFGKKGEPKKTENKSKTPIAPQPAKPSPEKSATPAEPVATPQADEDLSLDFSAYVPPPQSTPQEAAPVAVAQPPDVSALASLLAAQVTAVAPVTPAGAVVAEPAPAPTQADSPCGQHRLDSVVSIEVSSAANDIAPVIEETAILFAKGNVEEALSTLSRSVREEDLGVSALQAWLMLFDLYQHLGMRVEFETLALEFVVKFERSPPAWVETAEPNDPALATGGIGYFALSGMLTEASAPELEKLRATTGQSVRLECGKLQGLDGPGCRLLRDALLSLRDAGKEVMLTGETQLTRFLEEACQAGRIETDGAVWALLFEVYRMLDLKDKFEEAAVNYAVTFEVSPPSWELQPGAVAKRPSVVRSTKAAAEAFTLSGEITGANEALAKELQDWAAAHKMLVIDMSGAKRVDLVAAGLMLKVLSELQESGATIQIRGANELISALFGVTGIGKVARIIPRK